MRMAIPSILTVNEDHKTTSERLRSKLTDFPGLKDVTHDIERLRHNLITSVKNRLSKKTLQTLRKNYNQKTIATIFESIGSFDQVLLKKSDVDKMLSKQFSTRQTKSKYKRAIHLCDALLKAGIFLSDNEIAVLSKIQQRASQCYKGLKEAEIDPVKASMFYENQTTGSLGSPCNPFEWTPAYLEACLSIVPKKPKGRPKDIFFKALQIVVYKILTAGEPKKVTRFIGWAKKLTADIINECYPNLPKLTAVDIDNSIRSV